MHAGPNTSGRRGHRSPLALATAALVMAALAAAPVPSSAASRLPAAAPTSGPAAASQTANTASKPSQLEPVTLPGLTGSEYTVTLPTGDQLRLTGTGSARYTISTIPTAGASPMVGVRVLGDPRGATSITAQPANAIGLLASDLVDRQLFDVKWLIDHGDTGPAARLPITIEYPGQDAPTFTATAAALPGATVIGTSGSTVSLTVAADQASAFWAALTGHTGERAATPAWAARAQLTGGAARIWLTGHQAEAVSADGQPAQTVTVIVKKAQGPAFYCNGILVTLCGGSPVLARVSGTGVRGYIPISATYVDQNPCTTTKFTYTVPTGVYEVEDNGSFYVAKNRVHLMELADPQFTVAGDTSLTFDADNTVPVAIDTPRPSDAYNGAMESNRTAADGSYGASFAFAAYGYSNFEALPTTEPVTIGTYNFSTVWALGKPPVTMSVDSPRSLSLHPTYPWYTNTNSGLWFARFSGRRNLPLVSAGYGTAQDFAGIDVRGKLALERVHNGDCCVYAQLRNALNAGAAGVIFDPTDYEYPGFDSELPLWPLWWLVSVDPVNIPFAAITSADAAQLNKLLAAGQVNVDVADGGTTSYLYNLKFSEEEKIPASMHYTVADRQLAKVTTNYHESQASTIDQQTGAFLPHEHFVAGTDYGVFKSPTSLVNYYGPITPDLVWVRDARRDPFAYRVAIGVFDHADPRTERWFDQPGAPGAALPLSDMFHSQPGRWTGSAGLPVCSFCRQGNTFYPFLYMTTGSTPRLLDGPYYFHPNLLHLYQQDGTEVPQSKFQGQYPVYELPASSGRYRLTAGTDLSWTFTSSRPAQDATPEGTRCLGSAIDPCAPDPLLFLRYDAFTDLHNAVTASSSHRLRITPYYQADTAPAKVTTLKVWTSTDGGKTWQQAALDKNDGGDYTAHYTVPALSATDGHVSIKAEASDSAGGTLTETLTDAYSLTARTP